MNVLTVLRRADARRVENITVWVGEEMSELGCLFLDTGL